MYQINTAALTNRAAVRFARRVVRDLESGIELPQSLKSRDVPGHLVADLVEILWAVKEGWFDIPLGHNLTYSKVQHSNSTSLTRRAPWLMDLAAEAQAFEAVRAARPASGRAFGVRPLPDYRVEAQAAATRLSRLPSEHTVGAITLDLWVQVLQDTQSVSGKLRGEMECLRPAWMWDHQHPMSHQVQRLKDFDCLHLLPAYVSTTRNKRLDPFERRLLEDVQYRHMTTEEYCRLWSAEIERRDNEDQARWLYRFALIRRLASILDGAATYHHGSLTRLIKIGSNGSFRLQRSSNLGEGLVVELEPLYFLGATVKIETGFMLANYCAALAEETEKASPNYPAYLEATQRAFQRITALV